MEALIVIFAITAFILLSAHSRTLLRILGLRYAIPAITPVSGREVPEVWRPTLRVVARPFGSLGFSVGEFFKQKTIEADLDGYLWGVTLVNSDQRCVARLKGAVAPVKDDAFSVSFETHLSDGRIIVTENNAGPLDPVRSDVFSFHDPATDSVEDLWRCHQRRVADLQSGSEAMPLPSDDLGLTAAYNRAWVKDFEAGIGKGLLIPAGETAYRMSLRGAWNWYLQLRARNKFRKRMLARRKTEVVRRADAFAEMGQNVDLAPPQSAMIDMHRQLAKVPAQDRWASWGVFGVSMALFAVFFGTWWSWDIVPILIAVLLFHELGHFAAMRLVGYKQTSIFFIPGLGAAASGDDDGVSLWRRILVYLAGPLPGIALAFVLVIQFPGSDGWLYSTIIMLVILNWFNLLPFMPLDGGQVINALLGTRARAIFMWFSAGGLILLAWGLSEPILWMLGAFAGFSAFGTVNQLALNKAIDAAQAPEEADSELQQVMRAMQARQYDALDFVERSELAGQLLRDRQQSRPSWLGLLSGLMVYLLSFTAPVWLFISVMMTAEIETLSPVDAPDFELMIGQATDSESRLVKTIEAVEYHLEYYDVDQAAKFLDRAESDLGQSQLPNEVAARLLAAEIRISLLDYSDESNDRYHHLVQRSLDVPLSDPLAEALGQVLPLLESAPASSLFDRLEIYWSESGNTLALAGLLSDAGLRATYDDQPERSVDYLTRAVAISEGETRLQIQLQLASALAEAERYEAALEVYDQLANSESAYWHYEAHAWVAFFSGRNARALEIIELGREKDNDTAEVGWLLSWLMDNEFAYARMHSLLLELAVVDATGASRRISEIVAELKEMAAEGGGTLNEARVSLQSQLEYSAGFQQRIARAKVQVLDRYFAE
ncbi:MAG: hypothetical protein DHS20C11_32230 [Lysobacteraceae bacterium]|nr:MAG: hypothetical protein DHS20C11_32230 [Xanthomonadaceae bacterium]